MMKPCLTGSEKEIAQDKESGEWVRRAKADK